MKISVIVKDKTVVIDGEAYSDIDLSTLDEAIHAIQWNCDSGEVELLDIETGKVCSHIKIDSFESYQFIVDAWQDKKNFWDDLRTPKKDRS